MPTPDVRWYLGGQGSLHHAHQEHLALAGRCLRGSRCHRISLDSALVVLLLLLVSGLSTFAHATPPDPVWIEGIYDAADFDDVVWTLTNAELAGHSARPALDGWSSVVVGAIPPAAAFASCSIATYALRLRSPPLCLT